MSTDPAAALTLVVLSAAGLAPVLSLAGARLVAIPLCPLAGALVAGLSATAETAVGGAFTAWFVGLSLTAVVVAAGLWARVPTRRPWRLGGSGGDPAPAPVRRAPGRVTAQAVSTYRLAGVVGGLAVVATTVWCLRGLATPTVGFDARALWVMRAGWFLQSHHQLLIKLRVPDVVLIQSAYPPLVSASVSLAWRVAGTQSVRLGVVVIALLNACALTAAAFALVESGRRAAWSLASPRSGAGSPGPPPPGRRPLPLVPVVAGVVAAVLMVFVAAGITEPFLTNGYADPIWSLGALGAVAYGLQLGAGRSDQGAALVLVLVAGLSKNEGLVVAVAVIVLVAVRAVVTVPAEQRARRRLPPVATAAVELAVVGSWPLLMRAIHARGESSQLSAPGLWWSRADASFHGMAPYLHVLVIAVPVAAVGGVALAGLRRRTGLANDLWAWAALVSGLVAVGGAFVVGRGTIVPWLETTVHRVTEFSALEAWWIIAVWMVVASGVWVAGRPGAHSLSTGADPGRAAGGGSEPVTAPSEPLAPATR